MACGGGWTPGPAAEFFDLQISQGLGRGAVGACALPGPWKALPGPPLEGSGPSERLGDWEGKEEMQRAGGAWASAPW